MISFRLPGGGPKVGVPRGQQMDVGKAQETLAMFGRQPRKKAKEYVAKSPLTADGSEALAGKETLAGTGVLTDPEEIRKKKRAGLPEAAQTLGASFGGM